MNSAGRSSLIFFAAVGAVSVAAMFLMVSSRAEYGYLKVTTRTDDGKALSSFFVGLPRKAEPPYERRMYRQPCRAGRSGIVAILKDLSGMHSVRAANCPVGACGGHWMEPHVVPCGSMCTDPYKDLFFQHVSPYVDYCDGWQYDGTTACGNCEDCTESACCSCAPDLCAG